MINPVIRKVREPEAPTAAIALIPTHCPTTMVSIMLYNCWKRLLIKSGMEKEIISLNGSPSVKLRVIMFLLVSGLLNLYYILLLFKSEQYSHNNDGSNHNKDTYADVRKPDADGINGETADNLTDNTCNTGLHNI